ncbi:MAG TPA: phosphate ABC transporter substrate-binding/OmpA family protein [Candidatus Tectomicrobia bacterium]|nr:phosphate ABC transporter substrate-binding/OmpA family protein [Candidatus Tectomicrobia bacterium]
MENKRTTLAAMLIVLLGGLVVLAAKFLWPYATQKYEAYKQAVTSDSRVSTTIRLGGDGYLGYWFITAPDTRREASRRGIAITFQDDGGAYAARLQKFANREYDAIVLPVNSYLQHGAPHKFPGVIVAAIAESKGADGIVGFADKFPTGNLRDLNNPELKVVYTADSPSSFLLDLTIVGFDLFNLTATNTWRVEVGGARDVLERARRHEGDMFVLWEPELWRTLHEVPELKYLWGSDKFSGYIKDVFVFHRDFVQRHEKAILDFLDVYFTVMRGYANDRTRLLTDMAQSAHLKREAVENILHKLDWYDLFENATQQFGLATSADTTATDGLVKTIIACTDILRRTGKLARDPLEGNPYVIINSSLLEKLIKSVPTMVGRQGGSPVDFKPLGDEVWKALREIGTLRVEPITFRTGGELLDDTGKEQVDKIGTSLMNNYPGYRVAVRGHTGAGDEEENRKLSLNRAQVVVQYLVAVHAIDADRLRAEGKGSSHPPPRKPGESERAYRYRLPRVEFVLLEENAL